jgi:N-acetylmuramoyl-L-alanine amidase
MLKPTIALPITCLLLAYVASGFGRTNFSRPAAATPQTMYADLSAKEKAVRTALADPKAQTTVLKAVRTVVADYEAFVKSYPTSGFSDDALWLAGKLSVDAFNKFGEPQEKATAVRLLNTLASKYATSTFAKQVPVTLKSIGESPAAPAASVASLPAKAEPASATAGASQPVIRTITDIRRVVLPDVVRVVIELDGEPAFREERLENPPRVYVDLSSTKASSAVLDRTLRFDGDADLVRKVWTGRQPNATTRVVLDAEGVSSFSVYPLYSPYRLVIDCIRAKPLASATATPAVNALALRTPILPPLPHRLLPVDLVASLPSLQPQNAELLAAVSIQPPLISTADLAPLPAVPVTTPPPPQAPTKNIAGGFSIARQLGLSVSKIVIDPGHGGHDPGAKGQGQTEAELVLDIALRLEKLLSRVPGMEVVLTRRTDEFVHLQERTAIANRENADLFLSIHANASRNKQARGVETYFLNFATSQSATEVATRENAASGQVMSDLPNFIKAIALNNKLAESRDLATSVQRAMIEKLKPANSSLRDLGVKQAPFVVLIGAAMPSVLAEVSFLTNSQEGKLLKNATYRQRIADALFTAVRNYQTSLNRPSATVAKKP